MLKALTLSFIILCSSFLLPSSQAYAASGVGRVVHSYGPAWIERGNTREKVRKGRIVLRNDSIITGPRGRVKLIMGDGSKIYIGAKSRVALRKYSLRGKRLLHASVNMLWGKARFFVNKLASRDASFRVRTSTAVLGVRGTEFSVWVPPTPELLSRAFDHITLDDIPPLPTRTVLMEGAVDVDTGSGIQYRLTPGNTADVDTDRRVRVRKTNNDDLEETAKPLPIIKGDDASEKSSNNDTEKPKANTEQSKKPTAQAKPRIRTKQEPVDKASATSSKQDPNRSRANQAVKPAALPDNPQSSDASAIMLGDQANTPLDQPSMPAPPAVATPENTTIFGGIAPAAKDKGSTNNNDSPAPTITTPNASTLPMDGSIPIDTQATTNAIQNLGTTSDVKIAPNFVKP